VSFGKVEYFFNETNIYNNNTTITMDNLISTIKNLKTRPDWDTYFITVAYMLSKRSSCNRLNVGCVITRDNRIVSTGYNGHIPGGPHDSYIEHDHELMTIHAETNAVTDAAKRGVELNNTKAYVTHYPCVNCTKVLIAAGVKEIVYAEDYKNTEVSPKLYSAGNVKISKFKC
jgi:dCMP deaminase